MVGLAEGSVALHSSGRLLVHGVEHAVVGRLHEGDVVHCVLRQVAGDVHAAFVVNSGRPRAVSLTYYTNSGSKVSPCMLLSMHPHVSAWRCANGEVGAWCWVARMWASVSCSCPFSPV